MGPIAKFHFTGFAPGDFEISFLPKTRPRNLERDGLRRLSPQLRYPQRRRCRVAANFDFLRKSRNLRKKSSCARGRVFTRSRKTSKWFPISKFHLAVFEIPFSSKTGHRNLEENGSFWRPSQIRGPHGGLAGKARWIRLPPTSIFVQH